MFSAWLSFARHLTKATSGPSPYHQVIAAQAKIVHVKVNDGRPLNLIVAQIELETGMPISYEEAPLVHAQDLDDITNKYVKSDFRAKHPNQRLLVPRHINVTGDVQIPDAGSPLQRAKDALEASLALPGLTNFPVHFTIIQTGSQLDVVPVEYRSPTGSLVPAHPILDTFMSYDSTADKTFWQTMTNILAALQLATGSEIGLGIIPNNVAAQLQTTVIANRATARSLLQMAIDNANVVGSPAKRGPRMTWRLIYDPTLHSYLLHLRLAEKKIPAPLGGWAVVPITWDGR